MNLLTHSSAALLLLTAAPAAQGAPAVSLKISLAHNNPAERHTRDALIALTHEYDLKPWTWTRSIVIEQYAIPHSDPVLTLNTRHEGTELLSSYLHEQLHRYEDLKPEQMASAIAIFEQLYPDLPTTPPEGAADRVSSYTHIITCYSELRALSRLVGREQALKTIQELAKDHYHAIYLLVLSHEQQVGKVVNKYGLMPNRAGAHG